MIPFDIFKACLHNDPLQIYMFRKLGFKPCISNHVSKAKIALHQWYIRFYSQYNVFDNSCKQVLLKEDELNQCDIYYQPSVIHSEIDVQVCGDVLIKNDYINQILKGVTCDSTKTFSILFFHSVPSTPFQEYRTAVFLDAILNSHLAEKIETDYIYIVESSKNTCEKVSNRNFIKLIPNFYKYVGWYHAVLEIDHTKIMHPYLYPNMKYLEGLDDNGMTWKTEWAYHLRDITLLPYLQTKHREICSDFIALWENPCLLKQIPSLPKTMSVTISDMLELYFDPDISKVMSIKNYDSILPMISFHRRKINLFIDFETIDQKIYLIGIGKYDDRNHYTFEYLMAKSLKDDDLKILIEEFDRYLSELSSKITIEKIFYWHAEITIIKTIHSKFEWPIGRLLDYQWVDICRLFRETPILIRNCFNFKLKNIWKYLRQHGCINTNAPPNDCGNGLQSIDIAQQYYKNRNESLKEALISYNRFDCNVMYDIIHYLQR